jgi:ubiquitin C-terminal hydrolase
MEEGENDSISIDDCFKEFKKEEILDEDNKWYCNKCKEQRDIHKKLELYRLPKILII